ncbi:unnamed protein product [Gadus morhua 'NCC']
MAVTSSHETVATNAVSRRAVLPGVETHSDTGPGCEAHRAPPPATETSPLALFWGSGTELTPLPQSVKLLLGAEMCGEFLQRQWNRDQKEV